MTLEDAINGVYKALLMKRMNGPNRKGQTLDQVLQSIDNDIRIEVTKILEARKKAVEQDMAIAAMEFAKED